MKNQTHKKGQKKNQQKNPPKNPKAKNNNPHTHTQKTKKPQEICPSKHPIS